MLLEDGKLGQACKACALKLILAEGGYLNEEGLDGSQREGGCGNQCNWHDFLCAPFSPLCQFPLCERRLRHLVWMKLLVAGLTKLQSCSRE